MDGDGDGDGDGVVKKMRTPCSLNVPPLRLIWFSNLFVSQVLGDKFGSLLYDVQPREKFLWPSWGPFYCVELSMTRRLRGIAGAYKI
ncbi:hypothetical protein B296_00039660 [Ensete ventricosum]|uniref:Uncharacterized protein n=1 Tax=Ensete ventricosum TaxID=4639 RepID=A0A426ZSV8_ENSVE|nr:hypothetical protein B296_00039660 [Ensete ventricosum]